MYVTNINGFPIVVDDNHILVQGDTKHINSAYKVVGYLQVVGDNCIALVRKDGLNETD